MESLDDLNAKHNELAKELGREEQVFDDVDNAKAAILTLEVLKLDETTDDTEGEAFEPNAASPLPTSATPSVSSMNTVNRRGPTQGIGNFCKKLILEGKTNPEILAAVEVEFNGTAKTSASSLAFYRNALKGGAASRPRPGGGLSVEGIKAKIEALTKQLAIAEEEAKNPKLPSKTLVMKISEIQTAMLAAANDAIAKGLPPEEVKAQLEAVMAKAMGVAPAITVKESEQPAPAANTEPVANQPAA